MSAANVAQLLLESAKNVIAHFLQDISECDSKAIMGLIPLPYCRSRFQNKLKLGQKF